MNSLLSCRMKKAAFLRDVRSRLLFLGSLLGAFGESFGNVMPNVIDQISKE